ncbi:hypothetical protein ROZALSC1DRAFT_27745 [Rozella allomycis CSF55]|uniref:Uncharacterized protein n=1 Tax=Rozella allomycis (strain CSF55) TaxID=988480 RepID=A0A075AWF3_ROZAC|nr:hypothetical protein O9G_001922 [Rozella allomycis CSF55]RKP20795.1 hypothetical protein ROZALSC1DRAFT_27745 [Rozella allomycis CSF55]|eukprot:EPZ34620.1 hypothetical protein O9G_001922 [Rozella allomycis CSF55]
MLKTYVITASIFVITYITFVLGWYFIIRTPPSPRTGAQIKAKSNGIEPKKYSQREVLEIKINDKALEPLNIEIDRVSYLVKYMYDFPVSIQSTNGNILLPYLSLTNLKILNNLPVQFKRIFLNFKKQDSLFQHGVIAKFHDREAIRNFRPGLKFDFSLQFELQSLPDMEFEILQLPLILKAIIVSRVNNNDATKSIIEELHNKKFKDDKMKNILSGKTDVAELKKDSNELFQRINECVESLKSEYKCDGILEKDEIVKKANSNTQVKAALERIFKDQADKDYKSMEAFQNIKVEFGDIELIRLHLEDFSVIMLYLSSLHRDDIMKVLYPKYEKAFKDIFKTFIEELDDLCTILKNEYNNENPEYGYLTSLDNKILSMDIPMTMLGNVDENKVIDIAKEDRVFLVEDDNFNIVNDWIKEKSLDTVKVVKRTEFEKARDSVESLTKILE